MRLLMHICCANCAVLPLEHFLLEGMDVTGLWFNPNIHPYTEYQKRLESVEKLGRIWNFGIECLDEYPLDDFLKEVVGRGEERCARCYAMRLDRTARTARKMALPAITTSLLASPYQKFDIILKTGMEIAKKHGLRFVAEDLRKGWNLSRALSLEFDLYRQKYCGCIYSEMERYAGKRP